MAFEIPATINEQLEMIDNMDISYRTLHETATIHNKETDTTIRVPFSSIIEKYEDFLYEIIINLNDVVTNLDVSKYRFNPKQLSLDIYGTPEFWYILLTLNNCKSIIDFDLQEIKIYDPNRFKSYLNEIIISESE